MKGAHSKMTCSLNYVIAGETLPKREIKNLSLKSEGTDRNFLETPENKVQ